MRFDPRLTPLPLGEIDPETASLIEKIVGPGAQPPNLLATIARHPLLFKRWLTFTNVFMLKGSIPARERELIILRSAWRYRSNYEWGHHEILGRRAGLSDLDIRRVVGGPQANGWSESEAALLSMVDELNDNSSVSDGIWARLSRSYDDKQLLEILFLAGCYAMLAYVINTCRIEPDQGLNGLPDQP